jgi:vacuolar-type H+-ATPase subunit H
MADLRVIQDLIDKILTDLGEPTDGTGFLTRADVMNAISIIQQEISEITHNILTESAKLEPATDDEQLTIESNEELLEIFSAYRTETTEGNIEILDEGQIKAYDYQWRTRTGDLVRALIPELGTAINKARMYPIPDNGDNDIYVRHAKMASIITAELTIAGDVTSQLSALSLSGVSIGESDVFKYYWNLTDAAGTRTVQLYKDSAKANLVASGSKVGDGAISLAEQNESGLTGAITVTYTGDDTDAANIITAVSLEIPLVDYKAVIYGTNSDLLRMEIDIKDVKRADYFLGLYGKREDGAHTGEIAKILNRIDGLRNPDVSVIQSREYGTTIRTRPLYPSEVGG